MVLTTVNGSNAIGTGLARASFGASAGYVPLGGGVGLPRGTVAPAEARYGTDVRMQRTIPGASAGGVYGAAQMPLTGGVQMPVTGGPLIGGPLIEGARAGMGTDEPTYRADDYTLKKAKPGRAGVVPTFAGQTAQIGANVRWAELYPAMEAADAAFGNARF